MNADATSDPIPILSTRTPRRFSAIIGVLVMVVFALTGCTDLFAGGWGSNVAGQLGNNSTVDSNVPVRVDTSGVFADKTIVQVDAQNLSSCALASDGTAACWGRSFTPTGVTDALVPVSINELPMFSGKVITAVQAGEAMKCALTSDGVLGCWGVAGERVLGGALLGQEVTAVSLGTNHGCAVTAAGQVACWGSNSDGQLGDGTTTDATEPVTVDTSGVLAGARIVGVSAGGWHSCAVTDEGRTACWGNNVNGMLGDGTDTDSAVPVAVDTTGVLAGETVVQVSAGSSHTCARTESDLVACWGFNVGGQLGNGVASIESTVPVAVDASGVLAGQSISRVSAGGDHTCVVLGDQTASCWGANFSGQLGDGTLTSSNVPVAVAGLDGGAGAAPVVDVSAGAPHTLAVYEANPPSEFVPMEPVRVLDTRESAEGPLDPMSVIVIDGSADVPVGTTAVTFNITATGQTASGFLEVAPEGAAPGSSTLNWSGPQQTIANGYLTKLSAERKFQITLDSTGTTHVVLDITGYFAPSGTPQATLYSGADRRIYDSRAGDGPLPAGQSRVLNINTGGTPQPVAPTAAAINVTVTGTTGSGVLTAAKDRSSATSTINWSGAFQTVANAVITDVAADGSFTVTNNGGTAAEVIVDLTGTFAPTAAGATGAKFYAMDPLRPYDSRLLQGPLTAGLSRVTTLPIPADAQAVAVNSTITGTVGSGFLAVTPPGQAVPTTSTVNWFASPTTRANGSIVPVQGTALRAYTGGSFTTEYLYDVGGYFR